MTIGSAFRYFLSRALDRTGLYMPAPRKRSTRSYEAAARNRLSASWLADRTSADQEIYKDGVTVRSRARELERNDSIAKRYIKLCRKNIPGAFGFTLKMKIIDLDAAGKKISDRVANTAIAEAWADWSRARNCDITEQDSFRQMQHIVVSGAMRDGEYIVRAHRNKSKYGFQLELLDPDLIDETYTTQLPSGNNVVMGIEFDKSRRRVAYWIRRFVPSLSAFSNSLSYERDRIPASEIYYDFHKDRVFASRGVSEMSATMRRMKQVKDYESAAVTNAEIAARRLGFIESNPDQAPQPFDKVAGDEKDEDGNVIIDQEEGSFHLLPPGYSANIPQSNYPDAQHEMFLKSEGKLIASGLDVSYITLGNDLSETSYGSGRIGLLDERESWMMLQEWFIESFMERVFSDWLEMALLNGAIAGLPKTKRDPAADFDRLNKPYFVGKRWPWIDPAKDADATLTRLRAGLTSLAHEAAQNGDDIEEIFEEISQVNELAAKYGVTIDFNSKAKGTVDVPADENPPPAPGAPAAGAAPAKGKNGKATKEELAILTEN